jgi:ankyrin repeat protein
VQLLVDAGAEVNIQDKDGLSPLMVASYEGHVDVVRALLAKGARHDATNRNGHTPLHFAYANNKPQVIELLLQVRELLSISCTPLAQGAHLSTRLLHGTHTGGRPGGRAGHSGAQACGAVAERGKAGVRGRPAPPQHNQERDQGASTVAILHGE